MTPTQGRAMYRRRMDKDGETVTLRRVNASPTPPTDVSVPARVMGYQPEELVGGINQGQRKVIILAEDVASSGFPAPIRQGGTDKIIVRGRTLNIQFVDDSTRRIGDTLLAYELTTSG